MCAGMPVAVVGDYCLDAYWQIDMSLARLSLETPHFTRPVVAERYSGGAAANTAACATALGAKVHAFSLVGDDWRGRLLREVLAKEGTDLRGLIASPDFATPAYIKPLLQGSGDPQEAARFDFLPATIPSGASRVMMAALETALPQLAAVMVVRQFEMSPLSLVARQLVTLARAHRRVVFSVDARYAMAELPGMIWKPNRSEAAAVLGRPPAEAGSRWGQPLLDLGARAVLLTLDVAGSVAADQAGPTTIPAVPVQPPLDPVGAGDAYHAGATCALAAGASLAEAAELGSLCAAVTVTKVGQTGTAAPDEILRVAASRNSPRSG